VRGGDGRGGPLLSVCCPLAKKARSATELNSYIIVTLLR